MKRALSAKKGLMNWFGSLTSSVLVLLLLVCFGLGLAWQHVKALTLGYSIRELEQEKQETEHERRLLLLEKASLTDYHEIERKAKNRLGFREPQLGQELIFSHKSGHLELWVVQDQAQEQRGRAKGVRP